MAGAASPVSSAAMSARCMKSREKRSRNVTGTVPALPVEGRRRRAARGRGGRRRAWSCVVGVRGDLLRQRGTVVGDPAVAHHHRPVDQRHHRAELVGDEHDGRAALLEAAERVGERLLVGQVDAGGGLVEQEQLGLAGQRAGDEHPLLLAAGELRDAVRRPVGEADDLERRLDGPAGRRRASGAAAAGARRGRRRRPRAPWRARRRWRSSAGARSRVRVPVAEVRDRRAEEPQRPRGRGGAGRSRRAPGWTCPSRWRPAAATTLAGADRQVDAAQDRAARRWRRRPASRTTGRGAGGGHEHPLACWRAARFCAHEGKVVLVGGLVGEPLDRVEHGGRRRRGRRRGSRPSWGWPAARRRRW